jgi:hypothetical protein
LDILAQQIEAVDEMLDIIAKTQYGLEPTRYKFFTYDLLWLLDKPSSQNLVDIVKTFFVNFKFIPAKNMVDLGNADNYKSMIEKGDNYIIQKISDDIELQNKKDQERYRKEYEASQKQRQKEQDESRKRRDKQREESRKEIEQELKRMEKEEAKEAKRMEKEAKRRR